MEILMKMGAIVKLIEENLYGSIYTLLLVKMIKEIKLVYLNLKMKVLLKSMILLLKLYSMCNVRNGRLGNDKIIITYISDESLTDCIIFWDLEWC